MSGMRPSLRRSSPVRKIEGRIYAVGGSRYKHRRKPGAARAVLRDSDWRRGAIVAASLAFLLGGLLAGGYGVHWRMSAETARASATQSRMAAITQKEMRTGAILFVPLSGNVCKRRLIDNRTWMIHDAGDMACDQAVSWNATAPAPDHFVGRRLDAVRAGFRSKTSAAAQPELP